jgi:hypothetical protein
MVFASDAFPCLQHLHLPGSPRQRDELLRLMYELPQREPQFEHNPLQLPNHHTLNRQNLPLSHASRTASEIVSSVFAGDPRGYETLDREREASSLLLEAYPALKEVVWVAKEGELQGIGFRRVRLGSVGKDVVEVMQGSPSVSEYRGWLNDPDSWDEGLSELGDRPLDALSSTGRPAYQRHRRSISGAMASAAVSMFMSPKGGSDSNIPAKGTAYPSVHGLPDADTLILFGIEGAICTLFLGALTFTGVKVASSVHHMLNPF